MSINDILSQQMNFNQSAGKESLKVYWSFQNPNGWWWLDSCIGGYQRTTNWLNNYEQPKAHAPGAGAPLKLKIIFSIVSLWRLYIHVKQHCNTQDWDRSRDNRGMGSSC